MLSSHIIIIIIEWIYVIILFLLSKLILSRVHVILVFFCIFVRPASFTLIVFIILVHIMSAINRRPLRKIQSTKSSSSDNREIRKVTVPSHRLTPLKEHWLKIYTPVVEHLKLDIRFNVKSRNVEIRNPLPGDAIGSQHLQKAADFVKAFVYGFEVEDALALMRLDNLFVESFEVYIFLILLHIIHSSERSLITYQIISI